MTRGYDWGKRWKRSRGTTSSHGLENNRIIHVTHLSSDNDRVDPYGHHAVMVSNPEGGYRQIAIKGHNKKINGRNRLLNKHYRSLNEKVS